MRQRISLILATACVLAGCDKAAAPPPVAASPCGNFPGGGMAVNAGGAATGATKTPEGQVKDAVAVMGSSGEVADVVNQFSWQLCNARTNTWIDDNFYRKEMSLLRESAFDAFAHRAGRSPQDAAQSRQRACLADAGDDASAQAACK